MIDWINNFFGIKNEVSVPTLISLIVFIVGGFVNYLFVQIKEFNTRKINRNIFYLFVNEVVIDLKFKEKNIAKFYTQITPIRQDNWTYTQKSISYLDPILELDLKEIFNSYRKKFFWCFINKQIKNKGFHKIWSVLRNLKFFEEKIHLSIVDLSKTYGEHYDKYNINLETYRKFDEGRNHKFRNTNLIESQPDLKSFIDEENKIYSNWLEMGQIRTNYFYSYNNLVLPLLQLNRKYSHLETTLESGNLLLSCEMQFFEIKTTLETYQKQFKNYLHEYRKYQIILKKCLYLIK